MEKTDKPEKNNNNKNKHFWKDFKAELKKVIWPTKSQIVNNTIIVLVIVIVVTAICFVLDLAFEALNTYGIDKLKETVQNSVSETTENNEEDHDHEENNETDTNAISNEVNAVSNEIVNNIEGQE